MISGDRNVDGKSLDKESLLKRIQLMDGFFDDLERQMADHNVRGRDPWHQAEITAAAAYWSAVRASDALARSEECCREIVRLIDEAKREFLLNPDGE